MKNYNCLCPECEQSGWEFHGKGDWTESENGYIEIGLVLCFKCNRILSVAGLDYFDDDVKYDALREAAVLKFLVSGQGPVVEITDSGAE